MAIFLCKITKKNIQILANSCNFLHNQQEIAVFTGCIPTFQKSLGLLQADPKLNSNYDEQKIQLINLDLRSSLLTLGKTQASLVLLSLNRSLSL